ncbi:alpha/beta hydrolase [Helicobacter cholecystus]|uniref:Alpha/beta hydrolase n=1 Tax=Helicobacter cholecystus TaxID=45498 RepID=A0A3D8IW20_9HELI|nr:alpha/beta hydrolase [Helicobacter cholecystus]RDU69458.1 alpha/beta hydrolase [Helicobacter cholecystus]VEJ24009.1 2-hydroxy-6-oxohepta-2,4-dienoate hydrolase [Helicobacter cholecystus]
MAKRIVIYQGKEFEISYEILNPNQTQSIVFLHGWGSNKEVMKSAFCKILGEMRHIYIDLPGFGKSPNSEVISTYDYAHIIKLFLQSLPFKVDIIVGHSFGGKVATLLLPPSLVLLSSAGIVCPKPLSVRVKIIFAKILKRLRISNTFFRSKDAQGLNSAMYEVFKNVVDEDFTQIFANCTSKTLLLWGSKDKATPPSSAEKITSLIKGSVLRFLEGDHYFFLSHPKEVERLLLEWSKK